MRLVSLLTLCLITVALAATSATAQVPVRPADGSYDVTTDGKQDGTAEVSNGGRTVDHEGPGGKKTKWSWNRAKGYHENPEGTHYVLFWKDGDGCYTWRKYDKRTGLKIAEGTIKLKSEPLPEPLPVAAVTAVLLPDPFAVTLF